MNQERLKEVVTGAFALSGSERDAYVAAACGADQELLAAVWRLLAAGASAEEKGFLNALETMESRPSSQGESAGERRGEQPGERLGERLGEGGKYKLLELIGEGGFGSVYHAEQQVPVRRRVALKIIKLGMDTKQVIARFEAERQALALMDHPHIARVLDAGTTPTGRPFFVMDLVRGKPITTYADEQQLSINGRLELFQQVCSAVQHAHQKGIIHRDLKPANILVFTQDDKPFTKVIDFGIAKATQTKLTDMTLFTSLGGLIGTLEYMSPEQADGNQDIDTRSDVYALGVILYELLTGSPPFTRQEFQTKAMAEVQRIIREDEPQKPSTRLSTTMDTLASVAATRSTEPKRLGSAVKGELDWIVMQALEKNRARRYASPGEMAADIGRHLAGMPVLAAPPSVAYRAIKFASRYRLPLAAAGVLLILGAVGTVIYVRDIRAEQRKTLAALAEATQRKTEAEQQRAIAQAKEAEARSQAAIAKAVGAFQTDMLASADPTKLLGDKVTVFQAISAAATELDQGKLADQPLVEASVRKTLGDTYYSLARYKEAEPQLRKALEIDRRLLPPAHDDTVRAINSLAWLMQALNRKAEAEPLYLESLELRKKTLFPTDERLATSIGNLANFYMASGKYGEAESLFRESLRISQLPPARPNLSLAIALGNVGEALRAQGKLPEAEGYIRQSVAMCQQVLPAGHPALGQHLYNLGMVLQEQNRLAEAEPVGKEALTIYQKCLPKDHPTIGRSMNQVAMILRGLNRPTEAEALAKEALALYRRALPEGHPDISAAINCVCVLLMDQGKFAEAEPLLREGLAIARSSNPVGHPDIAVSLSNLSVALKTQNKLVEAEKLQREALEITRHAYPDGHPAVATCLANLAELVQSQKRWDEAESLSREALAIRRKTLPAAHPDIASSLEQVGGVLEGAGKLGEAEVSYREGLAVMRQAYPAGSAPALRALAYEAFVLKELGRTKEAEPLERELLAGREALYGMTDARTCRAAFYLAGMLEELHRPEEAAGIRQRYRLGDPATRASTTPTR